MKSLFIGIFIFFLFGGSPVYAASDQMRQMRTTILTYSVYAGGIHAMDAKLVIKKTPSRYETALTAQTQGFLKKMANWSGKFSSNGILSGLVPAPIRHVSSSTWKGKTESKTFLYDGKGKFKSYKVIEGEKDTTPANIDASLAKNTTDTLSATLAQMISLPVKKMCNGNSLIFDGDRSFRLVFSGTSQENLVKSDYNIFEGEAISCTVEVKPEGGKWRKKPRGWLSIQEQGRQKGALPTVWFGQLAKESGLYVPVKIRIKTNYGTLLMHLTAATTK